MSLPAFARPDDLAARLGRSFDELENARAQAALEDASAIIRAEAGKNWVTDGALDADIPDIVTVVCLTVARRVVENPEGFTEMHLGDSGGALANATGDVYLTTNEKRLIRSAAGRSNGLFTISTTREDPVGSSDFGTVAADGTIYVDVTPDGQPLPFLDEGQFLP